MSPTLCILTANWTFQVFRTYTLSWFWPWFPVQEKKKPELGWYYFSALHSVDTSCKILLFHNLEQNFHFSTTLFKNLIFEKHRVLFFCMKKILHFALPAKFYIFLRDLDSRFQTKPFFVVINFCGERQLFLWLNLWNSSLKYTHKYLYFICYP